MEVKTLEGCQLEIRPQCEASYDSTPGFLLPVGLSGGFRTEIDQKESHVCLFSIKQKYSGKEHKKKTWNGKIQWLVKSPKEQVLSVLESNKVKEMLMALLVCLGGQHIFQGVVVLINKLHNMHFNGDVID